ncbi:MAG: glycoside hydrolase family 36 protein [Opitutaceae bacterium]
MKTISSFYTSDMEIRYLLDGNGIVALELAPKSLESQRAVHRETIDDEPVMRPLTKVFGTGNPATKLISLAQLKVLGDTNTGNMTGGSTLLDSATTHALRYLDQTLEIEGDQQTICTELADERGLHVFHYLRFDEDEPFVEVWTEVENRSEQLIHLEMLASFCLEGISPFQPDDGIEKYQIHRFRSTWSAEGRHDVQSIEALNLERPWNNCVPRILRFGQVGSMPVRGHFPFIAFEDIDKNVLWGAQLTELGSWQMQVYRKSDQLSISGGLADRDFGHWMKQLARDERFATRPAILSCCIGDIYTLTTRMLRYQERQLTTLPASEEDLPTIFNEWCTTWGNPSEAKVGAIADRLSGSKVRYLVMDDGWFRDTAGVQQGLGDWDISKNIYPSGFANFCRSLREKGFIPGVWFEFESATEGSRMFENTEHQLHRDGHVITNASRRFLDFRDPWVHEYLNDKVIQMLKDNGIGYLKTDYNDSIGIGCDGAESLGEGMRQHLEGVERFFKRLREELPDLVIEVCSSGGHRLVPSWMQVASMGGFSDSHEGIDIPLIAANTQRMIPMRQNQIWAVLRKEDSIQRLRYSLAATFLGRMCLSGDIHDLSAEQLDVVNEATEFYQTIKDSIRYGSSVRHGEAPISYQKPRGYQAVTRLNSNQVEAFCVIHTFEDSPESLTIPLQAIGKITEAFVDASIDVRIENQTLVITKLKPFSGLAIKLSAM